MPAPLLRCGLLFATAALSACSSSTTPAATIQPPTGLACEAPPAKAIPRLQRNGS